MARDPGGYRRLLAPLAVGPLTLPSRVVFCAHLTNFASHGLPTRRHAAYYGARAAGGAGLIITEEHAVHPTSRPYEKLIQGYRREVIGGYRQITGAVHDHGVPVLAQLNHNGGQGTGRYSRLPLWAPSAVPDPLFREVPQEAGSREIREIVAGYGLVAGHCAAGGFDGAELQCSHSSIIGAFLSPATNHRTDEYGGSPANRARLLLEIIAVVRAAIGPGRALGVRICGDELIDGGVTLDQAVALARRLDATGQVDYLSTSIGVATSSLYMVAASMHVPPGYATFIPAAIRRAVSVPVLAVGRFITPRQADQALVDGHCDLVGVVRGQIADPQFAARARAGAAAGIRACLSCNQECIGRVGLNQPLGCLVNPRAGRESVPLPPLAPPAPPAPAAGRRAGRRVYVVGGGPAGLQAAVTAARRGHRVTLFERAAHTGGQVTVAARAPGRAQFGDLARDLAAAAMAAGAEVRTGQEVSAEFLLAQAPHAVVLATGSRPARPGWSRDARRVADVREVLDGTARPAGRVVVVDELGFHQATSAAEFLADRGCDVEVITSGMVVGQDLGRTLDLELWNVRAHAKGIRQRTEVVVLAAAGPRDGPMTLELRHHPTGAAQRLACDWVACAVPPAPADGLWQALAAAPALPFEVRRAGDCVAPRRAHAAVIEGERAGALP